MVDLILNVFHEVKVGVRNKLTNLFIIVAVGFKLHIFGFCSLLWLHALSREWDEKIINYISLFYSFILLYLVTEKRQPVQLSLLRLFSSVVLTFFCYMFLLSKWHVTYSLMFCLLQFFQTLLSSMQLGYWLQKCFLSEAKMIILQGILLRLSFITLWPLITWFVNQDHA